MMAYIRGRWLVVLLLVAAMAGVIPQFGGIVGNVISLAGIICVGILAFLRLDTISARRVPLLLFLVLAAAIVLQIFFVRFILGENTSLAQAYRSAITILIISITLFVIPNAVNDREAIVGVLYAVTPVATFGTLGVLIGSPIGGIHLTEVLPVHKYVITGPVVARSVPVSVFDNPNRLSAFSIAGVIGGVGLWRINRNLYGLIAALIAGITVVLSGSRTPFLVFPVALFVGYLVWCQNQALLLAWLYTFMLLIPVVIGTTIVNPALVGLVSQPRAELWAGAVQAVLKQPLFGYGLGESGSAIARFIPTRLAGAGTHNGFARIFVSGGSLVGVPYLLLLFLSITARVREGVDSNTTIWLFFSVSYISVQMVESFSMFSLTPTCMLIGLSTGYMINGRTPT